MASDPAKRLIGRVATVSAYADRFFADLAPIIADIRAQEATSLKAISDELNARGMMRRRGGTWGAGNVKGRVEVNRKRCCITTLVE